MPAAISATVPVQGTELNYFLLAFDGDNREREHPIGTISEHILAAFQSQPITDVMLFSHGWMGDVGAANEQYQGWLKAMWSVTADRNKVHERNPDFLPLLIGLHWPSLPWGNESLDAPLSFGDNPVKSMVSAYAERLGDSPGVRAALDKIVNVSQNETPGEELSPGLRNAYQELAQAVDLPTAGLQGAPGTDWEGFDANCIYQAFRNDDAEAGAVSFGVAWRDSLLAPLRALSFWKMKDRARMFGEQAVHPLLHRIQATAPQARTHLAGHSFGCIVASAAVAGEPGSPVLNRPVHSLVLLQGALSLWSYSKQIPFPPSGPGYFQTVLERKLVAGPIIATQSKFDTAVGTWYPRAARVARQIAFAPGLPKYGAVGTFGLQGTDVAESLTMIDATKSYAFQAGHIYNVDASNVINVGGGFSGAHSDIRKPEVAHLVWSAIMGG